MGTISPMSAPGYRRWQKIVVIAIIASFVASAVAAIGLGAGSQQLAPGPSNAPYNIPVTSPIAN